MDVDHRDWIRCEMCRHRSGVGFEGLNDQEAAFMTGFKLGRETVFAGANIGGDRPARLLLTLYSGLALRLRVSGDGTLCPLGLAFPGELLGFETLVGEPSLQLRALTDLTYCRFDSDRWTELLSLPNIAERLCRAQAIARRETEERLLAATRQSAAGNLCHFIVRTYEALAVRKLVRGPAFRLPLARQELAGILGLTPLHLRRVLARLASDNIVEFARGRVIIRDMAGLRRMAGPLEGGFGPRPLI